MKKIIALSLLFFAGCFFVSAQSNLSFTPARPKPGDMVNFTYEAPSSIFSQSDVINCIVYKWGPYCDTTAQSREKSYKPVEITLKRNGNIYQGKIQTDSLTRMLAFSFTSADAKWKISGGNAVLTTGKADNNQNEGYCIPLYNNDGRICRYSHFLTAKYLLAAGVNSLGIQNSASAIQHLLKEQELYPDAKYYTLPYMAIVYPQPEYDKFKIIAQKEMEQLYASGLQTERDISLIKYLSAFLRMEGQYKYFSKLENERFKDKEAIPSSLYEQEAAEKDPAKREILLNDIIGLYNKLGFEERMKFQSPNSMRMSFLFGTRRYNKSEDVKNYANKLNLLNGGVPNEVIDVNVLQMLADSLKAKDMGVAEAFIVERYKIYAVMLNKLHKGVPLPSLPTDEYYTLKEKTNEMNTIAAILADMATKLYVQKKDDKTAWKYATEAKRYLAETTTEYYKAYDINTNYALLAEKMLSPAACKVALEKIIVSGAWKPEILEVLKRIWVKENKSTDGFDAYAAALRQGTVDEAKKTLQATQLNYAAPAFTLKDLDGKEVSLQSLKGKTLVLDFWATWCGPCKASFPGMQKLVNYYKSNPDVQFLFVDTWEEGHHSADEKITAADKIKAVTDFMNDKKYPFHVLLDIESKTVVDFKVTGIPTKFIVDKNGNVRYKVVGFEANEGKLFDEVNAMIETVK